MTYVAHSHQVKGRDVVRCDLHNLIHNGEKKDENDSVDKAEVKMVWG